MVLTGLLNTIEAKTLFVGQDGSDTNPGSKNLPLKSLQEGVNRLQAGDTLFILAGTYKQTVKRNYLRGSDGNPVVISAYPGHKVVIDGTIDIKSPWELHEGNIFKTVLETDVWQLFVDEKMMTSARWPNAEAWTSDMWDAEGTWGRQAAGSTYGRLIDDGTRKLSLAGVDFTGAIAIMNIGSWLSFAEKVENHGMGSSDFTYTPHFSENAFHHKITNGRYFFEASLACLDVANEWFFNPGTKELYLYADDGLDPSGREIRGKTVTYAMEFNEARYLEIRNIDFFGCTVKLELTRYSSLENCNFLYASYSKRMLGSIQFAQPTLVSSGSEATSSWNRVINCSFEYTDGSGLKIVGQHDLVENCYFHNIDYSCVGGLNDITVAAVKTSFFTFRHNTINMGGNSLGVKTGKSCVVEYNRVSNIGFLQHDGSAIQTSSTDLKDVIFRRNWVTDCIKTALRFDTPWTQPEIYGTHGTMKYNVAWNARPLVPKGDRHTISHNTAFDNGDFDISIFSDQNHGGINTNTVTRNNAVQAFSGNNATGISPIPGIHDHNWEGISFTPGQDLKDRLYDPVNNDFRPRPGSDLVDAGLFQEGVTEAYIGMAPDIGAYEFGDTVYWIAGRKQALASSPVPADGGTTNYEFVDLMWQEGYQSDSSDLYFGSTASSVLNATRGSVEFMGSQGNNIYYPGAMEAGQIYYWRVDALGESLEKGEVWSFTAGSDANPPVYTVKIVLYGQKDENIYPLDSVLISMGAMKGITSENGMATLVMIREGEHQLRTSRRGYTDVIKSMIVTADTLIADTLEYVTYNISLVLKDSGSGKPVLGGSILFDGEWLSTDSMGITHLSDVEYASYEVTATAPGFQPREGLEVEIFSDTILEILMDPELARVEMSIVDRVNGDPLNRAMVYYADQLKLSNSSGYLLMGDFPEGNWAFTIEHNDYFPLTDSVWIQSDTSLLIHMTPRLADIQFEINDNSGPVSGARAELNHTLMLVSDQDGVARFLNQEARKEHLFTIELDGYWSVTDTLYLEIDTVVLVLLEPSTGILAGGAGREISIYPNPVSETLYLRLASLPAKIQLLSLDGSLLLMKELFSPEERIDVAELPGGCYLLRISSGDHISHKKVIIEGSS